MAEASDLDTFLAEELADPESRARFDEIAPLIDFGCALGIARVRRRLSRKRLAFQIGVPEAELRQIENGDRAPTLGTQVKLASALNARLEVAANGRIDFVLSPQPGPRIMK